MIALLGLLITIVALRFVYYAHEVQSINSEPYIEIEAWMPSGAEIFVRKDILSTVYLATRTPPTKISILEEFPLDSLQEGRHQVPLPLEIYKTLDSSIRKKVLIDHANLLYYSFPKDLPIVLISRGRADLPEKPSALWPVTRLFSYAGEGKIIYKKEANNEHAFVAAFIGGLGWWFGLSFFLQGILTWYESRRGIEKGAE